MPSRRPSGQPSKSSVRRRGRRGTAGRRASPGMPGRARAQRPSHRARPSGRLPRGMRSHRGVGSAAAPRTGRRWTSSPTWTSPTPRWCSGWCCRGTPRWTLGSTPTGSRWRARRRSSRWSAGTRGAWRFCGRSRSLSGTTSPLRTRRGSWGRTCSSASTSTWTSCSSSAPRPPPWATRLDSSRSRSGSFPRMRPPTGPRTGA